MTRTIAKCIGILSLWIGLFLSGCQTGPAISLSIGETEVLAEFPFTPTVSRPAIILPVRLDGHEYSFLLDTGAEVTVFDASLADKLKGQHIFPAIGHDSAGVAFTAFRKDAPDAYVGPLSLRHCRRVVVMDIGPWAEKLGVELHGILGMDFLKIYCVRFDPKAKVVQFMRTGSERGWLWDSQPDINRHPEWGTRLAMRLDSDNLPRVKGRFGGETEVDFLLDTGHMGVSNAVESKFFSRIAGGAYQWESEGSSVGITGNWVDRKMRSAFVEDFRLGPLEYDSVLFYDGGRSVLGLIFLGHHQFTFDFPNRRLYLRQLHRMQYKDAVQMDWSNYGFVLGRKDGRFTVLSVEPGKAAHRKGLRTGDEVLQLSGQDVSLFTVTDLIRHLAFVEGELQHWPLEIARGGETFELTFKTENSDRSDGTN